MVSFLPVARETPGRSRVQVAGRIGQASAPLRVFSSTLLSFLASPEQALEFRAVDGIRLRAVGKVNDTGPRDIRDRARHFLGRRAAGLVPVEQDRDVPGVGVGQELQLLDRDRGAHQRHGRDAQAVEADRAEEALDHDQVLAVLDPVEVEELELLVEARGQLVLALPFGKVLDGPTQRCQSAPERDLGSACNRDPSEPGFPGWIRPTRLKVAETLVKPPISTFTLRVQ